MTEEAQRANETEENWVVTALKVRTNLIRAALHPIVNTWMMERLSRGNDEIGYAKVTSQEELYDAISDVTRKVVHARAIQNQKVEANDQGRRTILTKVHGVEIGGEDLPQTDWQKSIESAIQDEEYGNDVSSCEELDREFEEESEHGKVGCPSDIRWRSRLFGNLKGL